MSSWIAVQTYVPGVSEDHLAFFALVLVAGLIGSPSLGKYYTNLLQGKSKDTHAAATGDMHIVFGKYSQRRTPSRVELPDNQIGWVD